VRAHRRQHRKHALDLVDVSRREQLGTEEAKIPSSLRTLPPALSLSRPRLFSIQPPRQVSWSS
jgi:hypothetical protein